MTYILLPSVLTSPPSNQTLPTHSLLFICFVNKQIPAVGHTSTGSQYVLAAYDRSLSCGSHAARHYSDVIMGAMASQITSLTIVYSNVYSGAYQRNHKGSASLAIVRGIHMSPVNSPHKWPVTRKNFPFDDVIMKLKITNGGNDAYHFLYSVLLTFPLHRIIISQATISVTFAQSINTSWLLGIRFKEAKFICSIWLSTDL